MLDLTSGIEPASRYALTRPAQAFAAAVTATPPKLHIGMTLQAPGGMLPSNRSARRSSERPQPCGARVTR